mgnify:CR=1 FL=1
MPSKADMFRTYRGRRVCVTGGAGFIGSHLCRALVEHGAEVCVIDDLSNGRETNLEAIIDRIRFLRGAILDPVALRTAADGAEVFFHLAAFESVRRGVAERALYSEVNATGKLHVLEAARAAGSGWRRMAWLTRIGRRGVPASFHEVPSAIRTNASIAAGMSSAATTRPAAIRPLDISTPRS